MGIFQTIQPVDKHLSEAVEKCSTGFDHRGEYKVDFPYKVWCNTSGIALSAMNSIDSIVTGRWGWNFPKALQPNRRSESPLVLPVNPLGPAGALV